MKKLILLLLFIMSVSILLTTSSYARSPQSLKHIILSKTLNTVCEYAGSVDTLDNDIQTIAEGIYREDGLIMSGGYIHYDIHISRFNSFLIKATIVPLYHNPSNDADYYITDPIGHLLKIVVMYDLHEKTILPAYGSTISDLEEACFGKNVIPGKDYSEEK